MENAGVFDNYFGWILIVYMGWNQSCSNKCACGFVFVGFFNPPLYGEGNTSSLSLERSGISGSVPTQFYMPGQLPSVALFCGSLSCVCLCTSLLQQCRWRLECSWLAVKANAGFHCLSVIPLKMQRFFYVFVCLFIFP